MDEAIRWTSFALTALMCALLLRRAEPSHGLILSLAVSAIIGLAALSGFSFLTAYLHANELLFAAADGTVSILFRILGITLTTCFGAQACRDCGEGSLAMQLELLGGILSLVNALPLMSGVLTLLQSFNGQ